MSNIEKLKDLNDLNRGIYKCWIWGDKDSFYRGNDYLQKINYSIQDLNREIQNLSQPTMKEVIYIIVLVDWIYEAADAILKLLRKKLGKNFEYPEECSLSQAKKYLRAIRSFVVAHPLNTNRHKEYGFDGDFICVDVRHKTSLLMKADAMAKDWYHLNIDGMQENGIDIASDFVLYACSEQIDGNQFYKIIGANFSDLYYAARLQIENLYELDRRLSKLKKKEWVKR